MVPLQIYYFTHFSGIFLWKRIERNYFIPFLVIPISEGFIGLVLLFLLTLAHNALLSYIFVQ